LSWVDELSESEYLALQPWRTRLPGPLPATPTCTGTSHPFPPAVPYHQQLFYALRIENGVLNVDDASQAALAKSIRDHL
jgi:hypothetical protein